MSPRKNEGMEPLRSSVDDAAWPRTTPPLLQTLGISRDRALKSLATLDRGEFRWEFLTPWVDRDLTRTDKVIVCSTFIGLAVVAQELIEPSTALAQHLSYVATFFSYAAGDQVVYRAIAILASLLEIFAYGVEDGAFCCGRTRSPRATTLFSSSSIRTMCCGGL